MLRLYIYIYSAGAEYLTLFFNSTPSNKQLHALRKLQADVLVTILQPYEIKHCLQTFAVRLFRSTGIH